MLWLIVFLIAGYEIWAELTKNQTITQIVVKFIPFWVTLPFIIWLFGHFAIRYFSPAYRAWLRSH